MERIEPLQIIDETGKSWKFCGLEYCSRRHYSFGYCVNHYNQYKRLGFVRELVNYAEIEYGPCIFPGCVNTATTKRGKQLCSGHLNQVNKHHHAYTGELRPLKYQMNEGFTETGRICKVCKQDKPLDEFYDRNGHKGRDKMSKAKKCKECYKQDVRYYQGREDTLADGTDPLGYAVNPEEKQRQYAAYKARMRKYAEQRGK